MPILGANLGFIRKKIHVLTTYAEKRREEDFSTRVEISMSLEQLTHVIISSRTRLIGHFAMFIAAVLLSTTIFAQDDIDDIETDMEAVMADSEAATSEASDAKKREQEEKERLKKAKSEATTAMARAKAKEESAKIEIRALETKIANTQKERERFEKQKAAAEQKIVALDQKIAEKKSVLEKVQAERDAARSEKQVQDENLAKKNDEKKELEKNIRDDYAETQKLNNEIVQMKKQTANLESKLVVLRKNALKEAEKRERAKLEAEEAKRKMGAVPTKVVVRTAKVNCDITETAGDAAVVVSSVKKGQKVELYKIVNKRWVEVSHQGKHGFMAKTCF